MADLFTFEFTGHTRASAQRAFDAVANAWEWAEWGKPVVRAAKLTRTGSGDERGVGAVRSVSGLPVGPLPIKEQTTVFEPGERYAYRLLTPAPLRDYNAELRFTPTSDGTDIRWSGSFEELVPGTGPLVRAGFRKLIGAFHGKLLRYLDQAG